MSNAIAPHGLADLDTRDVRREALPLDRHAERRRAVVAVVAVSAGLWAAIAGAAWAALQSIV